MRTYGPQGYRNNNLPEIDVSRMKSAIPRRTSPMSGVEWPSDAPEGDVPPEDSGSGFTGPDVAGLIMQGLGAVTLDREADRERAIQELKDKQTQEMTARTTRENAQQFERSAAQNDRSMNMRGAEMLAGFRAAALKNRRLYSTRKAIAGAF